MRPTQSLFEPQESAGGIAGEKTVFVTLRRRLFKAVRPLCRWNVTEELLTE